MNVDDTAPRPKFVCGYFIGEADAPECEQCTFSQEAHRKGAGVLQPPAPPAQPIAIDAATTALFPPVPPPTAKYPWEIESEAEEARLSELPATTGPVLLWLDEVTRKPVRWFWLRRMPLGKITLLEGDPDLGKSTLMLDVAARNTRGRDLPDGSPCQRGAVVVLSAEDGVEDTIRARFEEAGGDCSRLAVLTAVVKEIYDKETRGTKIVRDLLSLTTDIAALQEAIERVQAKFPGPVLTIVDPMNAYIGEADTYKDQEVRRVLGKLAGVAESTVSPIVLIRHPTKTQTNKALHHGGGSIGIIAAARSAILVVEDPADKSRRLFATFKHNLCEAPPTLAYRLVPSPADPEVAIVEWQPGTDPRTADQLLAASGETYEQKGARGDAREFLLTLFSDRAEVPAKDVTEAAKNAGITVTTLRRASEDLGIHTVKSGFGGGWAWRRG